LPLFAGAISLNLGHYRITLYDIFQIFLSSILGRDEAFLYNREIYEVILFKVRLPRVILAMLGGIALATSGASLQAIFRNPLVDSYVLGISAGAGFGAALAIAVAPNTVSVQLSAFAFGLLAFSLTYLIARVGGDTSSISLVLAGIVISALFSSCLSLVKFFTEPQRLTDLVNWLMGSLSSANWENVFLISPIILICFIITSLMRWRINIISMGDEEARSLGVNTERDRLILLVLSTLMVSSFTSVAGIIGWVGLIVPHMSRMLMKTPDNRLVLPASVCLGSTLLLLADDLARCLTTYELPIGVLTTVGGAPFFLYLLRTRGRRAWKE
ncbi:MAG: iron ABC transporter permease, partial [Candidatus Korarchaeum sp.]|nr:iron ABC transporter permease [Candidatus Korarchaeum sp.]